MGGVWTSPEHGHHGTNLPGGPQAAHTSPLSSFVGAAPYVPKAAHVSIAVSSLPSSLMDKSVR